MEATVTYGAHGLRIKRTPGTRRVPAGGCEARCLVRTDTFLNSVYSSCKLCVLINNSRLCLPSTECRSDREQPSPRLQDDACQRDEALLTEADELLNARWSTGHKGSNVPAKLQPGDFWFSRSEVWKVSSPCQNLV